MASRKAYLARNIEDVDVTGVDDNDSLVWDSGAELWKPVAISGGGGGGGGHTIQDEGIDQTQRTNLNFEGSHVTVLDDSSNDATKIIISLVSGILSQEVYETLTAQVVSGISHFNLSDEVTEDSLRVYYNGIRQQSNYFVVDPDNLGFTTAFVVETPDEIFVDYEVITSGIGILDTYFTSLLDTPSDYTDEGEKFVKVNVGEDALEFVTVDIPADFPDLGDTPANYTAASGLYVRVKDTEDGVEFTAVEAGAGAFLDLTDTPADYSGQQGKVVAVTNEEDALEFIEGGGGGGAFTDLTDVPSDYSGEKGKHVLVNDAEDALEFVTISGGAWTFDDSTGTFGIDQDRNTGGSFAYLQQIVWIARPMLLTSVLWDIRISDNYTMTVRDVDENVLATKYVASISGPSEDEEFALDTDLLLEPGFYRFRMTPDSAQLWSDKNGDVNYYFNSFVIMQGVDYGGAEYTTYRAPLKLEFYDSHTIAGTGDIYTDPILGDFSWINQDTATADDTYGGIFMTALAVGGDQLRILKQTAPSTPWTLTVALIPQMYKYNYNQCGIGFRQSSDGKLISFTVAANAPEMVINKWDSPSTYNSGYLSVNWNNLGSPCVWLRLEDDGVDRIMSWSLNGVYWTEHHSVGRTDFLTADEIFMYVDSNHATYPASCLFLSWKLT
jgi:hypothetical protein